MRVGIIICVTQNICGKKKYLSDWNFVKFLYVNNKIIEGAVDITSVGIQISVTQNICEKKKGIFIWLKILSTFPCTWSLYLGEYTEIMIIKQCH